jgi:hypothetical protein
LSVVVRGSICRMCRGSSASNRGVRAEQPRRAQRRTEFASNWSGGILSLVSTGTSAIIDRAPHLHHFSNTI